MPFFTCLVFQCVCQANPEHSPVVLFGYGVDLPDSVGGRLQVFFSFFFFFLKKTAAFTSAQKEAPHLETAYLRFLSGTALLKPFLFVAVGFPEKMAARRSEGRLCDGTAL